ncbi:TetR/AcrR family transcriptional regulator [Nonomuraea guangzhouensis]|uniref:TetR/AcrR family transcriptional regulator n=1 Tax=Nonomuraea guangzhouensis TaxID=1291555 RepID=A0ABW4GQH9_9ACTN|nr:TetR/AcrR family transcriptional regulator [Nonomuraea guangzhouensis]
MQIKKQSRDSVTNAARRAQIVRAAIETIAEIGYEKATFATITERAGLSSPRMISYHFAGKQDLIRQIVEDVYHAGAAYILERVKAETTAPGRLRAYLESNLEFLREHPTDLAALTEIGPHLRDQAGEPYSTAGYQEPSVQGVVMLLEEGQRGGEFGDFDARSMAVMIRAAIDAAAPRMRGVPALDFDAYRSTVVGTFVRATQPAGVEQ